MQGSASGSHDSVELRRGRRASQPCLEQDRVEVSAPSRSLTPPPRRSRRRWRSKPSGHASTRLDAASSPLMTKWTSGRSAYAVAACSMRSMTATSQCCRHTSRSSCQKGPFRSATGSPLGDSDSFEIDEVRDDPNLVAVVRLDLGSHIGRLVFAQHRDCRCLPVERTFESSAPSITLRIAQRTQVDRNIRKMSCTLNTNGTLQRRATTAAALPRKIGGDIARTASGFGSDRAAAVAIPVNPAKAAALAGTFDLSVGNGHAAYDLTVRRGLFAPRSSPPLGFDVVEPVPGQAGHHVDGVTTIGESMHQLGHDLAGRGVEVGFVVGAEEEDRIARRSRSSSRQR